MKAQTNTKPSTPAVDFPFVYQEELDWVMSRRSDLRSRGKLPPETDGCEQALSDANDHSQRQELALEADLCGLAISGGGIRSATFALGVLQGLAIVGLLPRFDYLSTVSGGGYIGSWLSAWINRAGFDTVETQLQPPRYRQEPLSRDVVTVADPSTEIDAPPLHHVRQYSNYLAPKPGLFSFDGWVLIAIYLRNLLLNQCVLLLAAVGLFVGVRCVVELYTCCYAIWFEHSTLPAYLLAAITLGTLATAAVTTGSESAKHWSNRPGDTRSLFRFWSKAIGPWLLAAVLSSLFALTPLFRAWIKDAPLASMLTMILGAAALHALLGVRAMSAGKEGAFTGLIAGGLGGLLLWIGLHFLTSLSPTVAPNAVLSAPLCLGIFVVANFVHTGLLGGKISELEREWWSSVNSRMLMCGCAWLVLFAISIYGPWLLGSLIFMPDEWDFAGRVTAILGTGWIGALVSGLWAAQHAGSGSGSGKVMDLVARFAPPAFLVSLMLAVALMTTWITYDVYASLPPENNSVRFQYRANAVLSDLDSQKLFGDAAFPTERENTEETPAPPPVAETGEVADATEPMDTEKVADVETETAEPTVETDPTGASVLTLTALAAAVLLALSHWLGGRIGVNTFSLQNLYANRLVRCYLGASRPSSDRSPHPIVNLDPNDNLPISQLFPGPVSRGDVLPTDQWGPLHIVNGALNRKAGHRAKANAAAQAESLMFLDRKAESFVFTPLYSGSDSTKYCPSNEFAGDVKLGTAVAVSGAAVSPNMGYHSSAAITALLTLFNIRMGAWFGNPSHLARRRDANPPASWWILLKELAGATDADSQSVYVSDGGHFENVGVYELIRRRCRFILAVEAGADPKFHENVGRIVRQARIDFGVRIELDSDLISPDKEGISKQHLMVGRIHYGDVHPPKVDQEFGDPRFCYDNNQGIIVWIKNSITGDEPGDLKNHRAMHPEFPYDSTADQFFTESQFESYRELGLHSVHTMLTKAKPKSGTRGGDSNVLARAFAAPTTKEQPKRLHELPTRDLFQTLFDSWSGDDTDRAKRGNTESNSA